MSKVIELLMYNQPCGSFIFWEVIKHLKEPGKKLDLDANGTFI